MKNLDFTAFVIAIAMAWAGFASSSFAFSGTESMPGMASSHEMLMTDMNMPDCPSKAMGKMSMDKSKCAVSCYGLTTSVAYEASPLLSQNQHVSEPPAVLALSFMVSHIRGVPTPPPNFA